MKLTPRQEKMVSAFLKAAARDTQGLEPRERAERLARMKASIREELLRPGGASPTDDAVAAALHRCSIKDNGKNQDTKTPPASAEPSVEPAGRAAQAETGTGLASDQRCWLGVCAVLGDRFGVRLAYIRTLCVLLGILAGPVALLVYTALYFQIYFTARDDGAPRIDSLSLIRNLFSFVAITAVLYVTGRAAFLLADSLYLRFMEEELVLDQWGWLANRQQFLLQIVILFGVPMAILCSLPMRREWDYTWKRVMQAGLAVYAAILSFGIASILVGVVLLVIEGVVGPG
jgi:phage shock protein PspC (stress-responsive transcriptional regulator)